MVSLRGSYWDQYPLIPSSLTQTQWDQVHPEQIYRWQQSEWCGWHAWGVDAMQRDLDKLKQWSCVNIEVQHGQVQAPVARLGQFLVSIKAGGWKDWEDTSEKDLRYSWMKSWSWADTMHLQPESQLCSGPGRCLCPSIPLLWELTRSTASGTGALSTRKMWPVAAGPAEGHKNDQMDWTSMMKGWES